jgi:hypothetical protein
MAKSQDNGGVFIMSSVGSIQNWSNNSMSVTFSSNLACLNIQNGIAILNSEKGTGLFEMNCKVDVKFNALGIQLFPNPVNNISKLKFLNKPLLIENFVITVWTADGFKLFNLKASADELLLGKNIDFSSLTSGSFVIQVESPNYIDALKFVKAK